jgi:hypothetical protein
MCERVSPQDLQKKTVSAYISPRKIEMPQDLQNNEGVFQNNAAIIQSR